MEKQRQVKEMAQSHSPEPGRGSRAPKPALVTPVFCYRETELSLEENSKEELLTLISPHQLCTLKFLHHTEKARK